MHGRLFACCFLALLLRACVRALAGLSTGTAFDSTARGAEQEADCCLGECDMRHPPTPLCNHRPEPLGLALAADEHDAAPAEHRALSHLALGL